MKINKVEIKNFRSIKNESIIFDDVLALVGENNVGKSTVLRALNSVFNYEQEEIYFHKDNHKHSPQSHFSEILLTFEIVSQNPPQYIKKCMKNQTLTIRFRYSYVTRKRNFTYKTNKIEKIPNEDKVLAYIDEKIQYVYIPVERSIEHIKYNTDSLFKKVISDALSHRTKNRDTVSAKIKPVLKELQNNEFSAIAKKIEDFYLLSHSFRFNIHFDSDIDYKLVLNNISLSIKDNDRGFHLKDCGSGVISTAIIAMHLYLAEMNHSNVVFGIEEPEINLHPQAQKELIANMIKHQNLGQLIITTHSPIIIDQLSHHKIVLVRKSVDDTKHPTSKLTQLKESFYQDNNLKEYQYNQFFSIKNSDFFYSKLVIISESKNDSQVINHILNMYDIDLIKNGITILNLGGVKNFKYPYYLFKELEIPNVLVVDKDLFLPYKNRNKAEDSRDSNGFPEYSKESYLKKFIRKVVKEDTVKFAKFKLVFAENKHGAILDFLEQYNIVCMRYNLECDIIASSKGREEYYNRLGVSGQNKSSEYLLRNRLVDVKKIENMMYVVEKLNKTDLPFSFRRIPKVVNKVLEKCI